MSAPRWIVEAYAAACEGMSMGDSPGVDELAAALLERLPVEAMARATAMGPDGPEIIARVVAALADGAGAGAGAGRDLASERDRQALDVVTRDRDALSAQRDDAQRLLAEMGDQLGKVRSAIATVQHEFSALQDRIEDVARRAFSPISAMSPDGYLLLLDSEVAGLRRALRDRDAYIEALEHELEMYEDDEDEP